MSGADESEGYPLPSVPVSDVRRGGGSPPLLHCNSISPYRTICDCRAGHEPPHESFGGYTWTDAEAIKPKRKLGKKRLTMLLWIVMGVVLWNVVVFLVEWSQSWRLTP
jgi:hypothetical protein